MSPAHTPWTIPKRFTPGELYAMRRMTEWEIEDSEVTDALGKCLDEIERLYEAGVAEVYVEQPLPQYEDLMAQEIHSLVETKVTIMARRLDRAEWIGVKAKSIHALIGTSKEQVRRYLDDVVGK